METPRNCATACIYIFMRGRGEGLAWNKASSFAARCSLAFNANLIVYVMFVNCRQAWCLKFDRRYYFEILNETWKISGWIYSFSDEITETKSSEQNLDTIFIKLSFVQGIIKKKNVYYKRFTFVIVRWKLPKLLNNNKVHNITGTKKYLYYFTREELFFHRFTFYYRGIIANVTWLIL